MQRWDISDLTWDTVNEFGLSHDELRIRLKFRVTVSLAAKESTVFRIGYSLLARGGLSERED